MNSYDKERSYGPILLLLPPSVNLLIPSDVDARKKFERIHCLSTSTILNKMGFHCNLPCNLVFAPRELGGVGLTNLIYEQGTQQLIILIQHMRIHSQLGTAIEVLIWTYQLWAGIHEHVLMDTQPCPWIPDHWLSKLCATMHLNRLQVKYESWMIPPLHINDRYLMNNFADQDFPMHKLEKLNACRMYLQVTTLAEITNHTGELLPQALLEQASQSPKGLTNISTSKLQWPQVAMLTPMCWRIWTKTIQTLYTGSRTGTRLQTPLGTWMNNYNKHRFWHWRLSDPTHLFYQQQADTSPHIALRTQSRHTLTKFSPTIPTQLPF